MERELIRRVGEACVRAVFGGALNYHSNKHCFGLFEVCGGVFCVCISEKYGSQQTIVSRDRLSLEYITVGDLEDPIGRIINTRPEISPDVAEVRHLIAEAIGGSVVNHSRGVNANVSEVLFWHLDRLANSVDVLLELAKYEAFALASSTPQAAAPRKGGRL